MQPTTDTTDTVTVTVTYTGRTEDGELFDQATDDAPLTFAIGDETVMPAIEMAVAAMTLGETRRFILTAEQAFGEHKEELVQTVDRTAFGSGSALRPGMILGLTVERDGETIKVPALVTKVDGEQITVDYNHPLAGKALDYTVTLKARKTGSR